MKIIFIKNVCRAVEPKKSGFATFAEREYVFDHVSGIDLELNSTRRLGTEVELHMNPVEWPTLSADCTLVNARLSVTAVF